MSFFVKKRASNATISQSGFLFTRKINVWSQVRRGPFGHCTFKAVSYGFGKQQVHFPAHIYTHIYILFIHMYIYIVLLNNKKLSFLKILKFFPYIELHIAFQGLDITIRSRTNILVTIYFSCQDQLLQGNVYLF